MSDLFYRAFEERYYASQDFIKNLRKQYLPFIEPLAKMHQGAQTFDIGCGRGEWLELMGECGLTPVGVDIDEGMLSACYEKGLNAHQGDAVKYLAGLPDESQLFVTAFHVVEHISFEELRTVVSESLRVLKPGGLLIMETPNSENIIVATQRFYIDPTHQKPLPKELLAFVPEYYGFSRIKTVRLQENKALIDSSTLTLNDVLSGVSWDYSIIAQKAAESECFNCLDDVFCKEYGLSLDVLATRYHDQIQTQVHQAKTQAQQAESKAQQAESKAQQAESKAQQAESKAEQLAIQVEDAWNNYHAVANSRTWRLTYPLRIMGARIKWVIRGSISWMTLAPGCRPRRMVRSCLVSLKEAIQNQPRIKGFLLGRLESFPRFKARLLQIGNPEHQVAESAQRGLEKASINESARYIYQDLLDARTVSANKIKNQ